MFTRTKAAPVPEVGAEAPEFNLPSAQGGQLRLSMRTVRGPVAVIFYRPWSEEDVEYFKEIAGKEDEINMAAGSVVGVGIAEPDEAREFARKSGMKSYVLYDYVKVTSRQWGLLEKNKERGEFSRPAVFIVGADHNIAQVWLDERPGAEEILAKISELTGLPKPPEKAEEKPQKEKDDSKEAAGEESAEGEEKPAPKKLSAEEREKIKAERRAAREAGKSLKKPNEQDAPSGGEAKSGEAGDGAPKKMSKEERERIKAERRAAREAGKSLKSGGQAKKPEAGEASGEASTESPEQPSDESGKQTGSNPETEAQSGPQEADGEAESGEKEEKRPKQKPAEGE